MSYLIAGKSDINSLLLYNFKDIKVFELYLGTLSDFDEKKINEIKKNCRIFSVHQPTYVTLKDNHFVFNLLSSSPEGQKSKEDFRELMIKCHRHGINRVVLHAARYDPHELDQNDAISKFINKLNGFPYQSSITIEYDVLWFNTELTDSLPLITNSVVLREIIQKTAVGITLDIEHFIISNFYVMFCNHLKNIKRKEKSEKDFKNWIHVDTDIKIANLYKELKNFVEEFKDRINHIHLNGTDWYNYFLKESLPLVGEHLPLGYNEEKIKDRMDYFQLSNILRMLPQKKETAIVLEVGKRDSVYDYFSKVSDSVTFLRKYL